MWTDELIDKVGAGLVAGNTAQTLHMLLPLMDRLTEGTNAEGLGSQMNTALLAFESAVVKTDYSEAFDILYSDLKPLIEKCARSL